MRSRPDKPRRPRRPVRKQANTRSRRRGDVGAGHPSEADSPELADRPDGQRLGPYELRYDVRRGYGVERTVVRP